jgi:hypothetical protein
MVTFSAQNAGNGISGLQISKISRGRGGGHAHGSPSYAGSMNMLWSDFWLDPPLDNLNCITCKYKRQSILN